MIIVQGRAGKQRGAEGERCGNNEEIGHIAGELWRNTARKLKFFRLASQGVSQSLTGLSLLDSAVTVYIMKLCRKV